MRRHNASTPPSMAVGSTWPNVSSRRLPDLATVASEVQAWTETRNQSNQPVDWHFTTEDAQIKLKRLFLYYRLIGY